MKMSFLDEAKKKAEEEAKRESKKPRKP